MFAYIATFNDMTMTFVVFSLVAIAISFALAPAFIATVIDAIALKTFKNNKRLHIAIAMWTIAFVAVMGVQVYFLIEFPKETLTASFWLTLAYMPFTKVVHNFLVNNILEHVELIQLMRFNAKNS